MFRQIYCWTKQADKNPEKRFDKLYSSISSLQSIRDKLLEMELYINGSRDYLNRINPKLANELSKTFTLMDVSEVLKADRDLLEIYVEVGRIYCEKAGIQFPEIRL